MAIGEFGGAPVAAGLADALNTASEVAVVPGGRW